MRFTSLRQSAHACRRAEKCDNCVAETKGVRREQTCEKNRRVRWSRCDDLPGHSFRRDRSAALAPLHPIIVGVRQAGIPRGGDSPGDCTFWGMTGDSIAAWVRQFVAARGRTIAIRADVAASAPDLTGATPNATTDSFEAHVHPPPPLLSRRLRPVGAWAQPAGDARPCT